VLDPAVCRPACLRRKKDQDGARLLLPHRSSVFGTVSKPSERLSDMQVDLERKAATMELFSKREAEIRKSKDRDAAVGEIADDVAVAISATTSICTVVGVPLISVVTGLS
jgi:hypothetical protein